VEIAADARERIARKQEGKKASGEKSKSQTCERRRKGAAVSGKGKCEKVANPYGDAFNKAVPPLNSTATGGTRRVDRTKRPPLTPMTGGPGPASHRHGRWRWEEKVESKPPVKQDVRG
jgi:hypothetical protein